MTVNEWLGKNNTIGLDIWKNKYQWNNETFDEWLDRVSGGDNELRELIAERKIMLGGRTLANRGTDNKASFFNCYSSGYVEDDYNNIMETAKNIGLTFKAQGGQGISLTKLRPKGAPISKEYTSDGIVPFMKIFNEVTAGTSQGGARKGALMLSIDVRHKEAETFIRIKSQEGLIEKANLSLEIDDTFMNAVKKYYETGEIITLHEKRNYSGHIVEYDVVPIEIFKALVDNCYDWADPAALFVNRFRNYNLMEFDDDYQIETSNPCGEQPLPKNGACCLSSINLSEFICKPYTKDAYIDTEELVKAVKVGIRTLDKLIDENYYKHPLKEQQEQSFNYRNIGLGCFGYATALMKLGLKYGSQEALDWTNCIFGLIFRAAVIESNSLAKEFGPFPKYKDCVWDSEIIKKHFPQDEIDIMRQYGLRNCSLISIAPTGSIATCLGESGGCEPEFALSFTRRTVGMTDGEDTYYKVYCKAAREYMELYKCEEKDLPDYFVSSANISWKNRVLTQSVMQEHVDTAISSTVNLPNETTKEDIAKLYLLAWEKGLKGITIFREGCKRMPILSTETPKKEEEVKEERNLGRGEIKVISDDVIGKKRRLISGCGSLHCAAYFDRTTGELLEVFLDKGSAGGCDNFMTGLSRMISLAARAGCSVYDIVDQLNSSGTCPSYAVRRATKHDTSPGSSCPVAVGNALLDMQIEINEELEIDNPKPTIKKKDTKTVILPKYKCPECGNEITFEGGCQTCKNCGWSKCS